jgi:hypothetical protein
MTDFFSSATTYNEKEMKRNTDCRTSAAGDESFVANQVFFSFFFPSCISSLLLREMRMTGKKAHEVKFSIPLAFCTRCCITFLLFISCMALFFLSVLKSKEIGYKTSKKHKFLFSCCKEYIAEQRQSVKCSSKMIFYGSSMLRCYHSVQCLLFTFFSCCGCKS